METPHDNKENEIKTIETKNSGGGSAVVSNMLSVSANKSSRGVN